MNVSTCQLGNMASGNEQVDDVQFIPSMSNICQPESFYGKKRSKFY